MHGSPTRPLAALVILALSGCVSPVPPASLNEPDTRATTPSGTVLPVRSWQLEYSAPLRTNRYTLANTLPRRDQLDLLSQVIDVHIPDHLTPSVQDAMTHVLRRSGYRLCPAVDSVQVLYGHPLPAAHYHLGPLTLGNALRALAGPAWQLEVDERTRRICFSAAQMAGVQE
ncbi:PilL N-terminal domain-containing protein [Pseudomonas vanderleydeniana]|uniref:PilL N-terminal domain-containing protein n=1 Tax=Pseudomonas vanderleydeniana TaxID=2745495 RepID=A0A9E6PS39_9PSED|nr:PilL N-terminal domain-containing protein [Pseudomonas vanderleydeniana]QXI31210.1 PilL N-terminal domain-containing protein [Pseudomonas vanderleydeniana]